MQIPVNKNATKVAAMRSLQTDDRLAVGKGPDNMLK